MLFIAVDQNLNGGKLRVLAKALDCSENEARGILINLWIWGISNCREDGYLIGAEKNDIAKALKQGMSDKIAPTLVVETLIMCNWLEEDEDGLYIHDWQEWNQIPMEYYAMLDKEQGRRKANAERVRKHRAQSSGIKKESNVTADQVEEPKLKEKKSAEYEATFEDFWKEYPRKADKGQAYKKYQARIHDGFSPDELIQAARNYARKCNREHTEQKYIKHGKTFLSDSTPFIEFIDKKYDSAETNAAQGDNPYQGL